MGLGTISETTADLVLGGIMVASGIALVATICRDISRDIRSRRTSPSAPVHTPPSHPSDEPVPCEEHREPDTSTDQTQMPEAARPDELVDPWVATYCPGCVAEARERFPNIEPADGMVPLACVRHTQLVLTRQKARIRLSCGRIIEHEIVEVRGYGRLYTTTNEEVAKRGWARCLWN